MSRSGYTDDYDEDGKGGLWRGAVASSIRGKRGQQALKEIAAALDALPEKELIDESLVTAEGQFCTLGALGRARGMDMTRIDPDDRYSVARHFGISEALAAEIMYLNDEIIGKYKYIEIEICGPMRPQYPDWGNHRHSIRVPVENEAEKRWQYMREWVKKHIKGSE